MNENLISDDIIYNTLCELAIRYNSKVRCIFDIDNNYCIWIESIDRLYKKKYLSNIEGRGKTYNDACIDYFIKILDSRYQLRYKKKLYATTPLRSIIKKNRYLLDYINNLKQKEGE